MVKTIHQVFELRKSISFTYVENGFKYGLLEVHYSTLIIHMHSNRFATLTKLP